MITLKLANGNTLHDVRDDMRQVVGYISDAKNAVGTLDFDIYPDHQAYNSIKAGSTKIRSYRDGQWEHDYTVETVSNDMQLKKHVTATDELQYLERIEVPSYKTGEGGVPQTVSGFFMWLVEYYNARSGGERFAFGHVEGDSIDPTTALDRSSDSQATVASIIKDKIIDTMGGYVRVRRVDEVLTIDLKADAAGVCKQYIEFGENLVDYADEQDAGELYTAITAESTYKNDAGDEVTITLADAPNGEYLTGYVKQGDTVTNTAAAAIYGVRRKHLTFDGIKDIYTLVNNCETYISAHCEPVTTVSVTAADLSALDTNVQSFDVGLYTRVKAAPMGFDAAFECQGAKRSLNDPTDDKYTLGWTWSSMSSINNRKSVEAALGIGKLEQATTEIDQAAKDAAQQATVANDAAVIAKDTADAANVTASNANDAATEAKSTATQAKVTADSKRRVFYSQPVPPYDNGDLWSQGTAGDMLICSTHKTDGMSFLASDWGKASKYTDDTKAIEAEGLAAEAAKTATDFIDFGADGLIVGDMTDGTLSGNVRIASDGIELRDGTSVLARLKAGLLELAANSVNAIIKLCGGKGIIAYYAGTNQLAIMSPGSIAMTACQTLPDGTVQPYDAGIACNKYGVVAKGVVEVLGTMSINGQGMSDYVVAQGTSGTWHYRKWASGEAECRMRASQDVSTTIPWGAMFYDGARRGGWALPFVFAAKPNVSIVALNGSWIAMQIDDATTTSVCGFWAVSMGQYTTLPGAVDVSVKGRWK